MWPPTGTCCNAPAIINTRYGVSLMARQTTSGQPERWPIVVVSGGSGQPVNHGEIARAIQPDGAMRNTTPIAIAACGIASTGATKRPRRRAHERPCATPQKATAKQSDRIVAAKPVDTLVTMLVAMPG